MRTGQVFRATKLARPTARHEGMRRGFFPGTFFCSLRPSFYGFVARSAPLWWSCGCAWLGLFSSLSLLVALLFSLLSHRFFVDDSFYPRASRSASDTHAQHAVGERWW